MKNDELLLAYKHYYTPLYLYAYSLTKHKEDAEDLVATTFVKALLSFEEGSLQSWLYQVLRNEFYTLVRKKKKIAYKDLEWIEDELDLLDELIKNEQRRWLYKEIYLLPIREREIMLLSLQTTMSDIEIAKTINLSVENVRVIKHRIKKNLIKKSQEEGL